MAAVARQVPTANPGSLRLAAVPDTVAMVSQQPGGVKALVAAHNSKLESSQRSGANAQKRSVSVSNGKSPPPPPPPARTSSRNIKIPYKEDVVIRDRSPSYSPSRAVRLTSVDRMERESSVERGKLSSASEGMTGEGNEERGYYMRQRSHTESATTSPARPGGKNRFNTIQWRGDVKYNPYTGATAQSIHGKLSASLNTLDLEGLIAPNDRIKKSMFEPGLGTEEEDGMGEDYGSGYRPTLMKISHGDIQKHAVAVTTPTVPPPTINRSGSDPNILESHLDRAGMTRGKTSRSGVVADDSGKSPSRHEDMLGVGGAQVADSGIPTTSIARAYREHLMEKMEKKKRKHLGSSGSSSASPSPSISSAESNTQQPQSVGDNLSAKLRSITPSQLQGIDVPDRAYYPKILPPASTGTDKRQEHPSKAVHNDPHNPFLLHSSNPVTSYDVPDMATYDTLPRKKPDMNQVQRADMGALKGPTRSFNEFHSTPTSHALQQQRKEWNRTNDLMKSLGSVEQELSQASMPILSGSRSEPTSSSGSPQHSSGLNLKAAAGTTPAGTQRQGGIMNSAANGIETSYRPPVLPKPASKWNRSSLTPPPANHERATSDPSFNYGQAGVQFRGHRSSASPQPTSPAVSRFNSGVDLDSRQQYSRGKQRLPGQQISTGLLEIQEADEGEEREKKTPVKRSGPTFADYVSLNSSLFPKRIRLCQDFCTGSKDVMLSQGDEFDLHFVRSMKSVLMMDSTGVNYTAPLTSIAKFSPIYDPFGSEKVAMQGFCFKTAEVLMDLRKPPSVVAATQSCNGGQVESSVEEGEILVLQGIKNVFHGRLLKAFSLKHHITKFLDEKCYGNFSTSPDKLEMSLTQIYQTSIPLPQKAQFHSTSSILDSVNTSLQSDLVILKQFTMAKSVITTALNSSSEFVPAVRSPSLSFSLDLDIDIQEVSTPETRVVQMRKKTQSLLDNFGKGPLIPYIDMPTTASYMAQCALLLNLDLNVETDYSEILAPMGVLSPKRRSRASPVRKTSSNSQISGFTVISDADPKTDSRIKALEDKYSALESKVQEACRTLERVSLKVDQVHTYLSKAQNAMNKHKKQLESERKTSQKNSGSTPHSSMSENITGSNVPASYSASTSMSRESSFSRPNSGLSLSRKLSSESESIDGGSDRRSLNDDVFVRANSTSRPPLLPKPKELTLQKQKKVEARSYVAEAKRKFSLGENTTQALDGSPRPHVAEEKRKVSLGENTTQALDGSPRPRIAEAKTKASTRDSCHPPLDSYPTVTEAKRRLSFGESNCQPKDSTPHVLQVKKRLYSDHNLLARQESQQSASTRKEAVTASATKTQGDSIDLKDYLLDSTRKYNPNSTSKTTPTKASPAKATPTKVTPTKATPTKATLISTKDPEFMSIEALTEDLTDWCTQVEDELTQMYNDSILSVS